MAGIVGLSFGIRGQKTSLERLLQEREKLQQLTIENQRLQSITIDSAEMERLRRETTVLLKLRNEFAQLLRANADSGASPGPLDDAINRLLQEREQILSEEQEIRKLSERAACIKNLEQIASAKARWASENAAENGLPVTMDKLLDYFPEHTIPVCPAGGHYSVNRIGAAPVCSIEGHAIP